jgi:hypothetical protein
MKMIWMFLIAAVSSLYGGRQQGIDCSLKTPESLHSDSCPYSLVESDAGKIASLHLQHNPAYHTYSRWNVSLQNYILAYWDENNELLALYIDLYRENRDSYGHYTYTKIGTLPAYERVERVLTHDLVGDGRQQLIILSEMGQLESIRIVKIDGNTARIVLDTAGTTVKIVDKPTAAVLVYAKTPNQTEVFKWAAQDRKFKRIATKPGPPKAE